MNNQHQLRRNKCKPCWSSTNFTPSILPNQTNNAHLIKILFFFSVIVSIGTNNTLAQSQLKNYQIKGYVKNLQSATIFNNETILGNTLHHRLNFKWFVNDDFRFAAELRNQLFVGDQVGFNSQFGESIGIDKGLVDLSFNWINTSSTVLNTQIDRFWLGWEKKKWAIKIGRQRINWGLNLVFNPNDLFNTYNFLDFDYEERPGTDAIKLTYNRTYSTSYELAISPNTQEFEQSVIALKYGFNKWQYDFQVIGGYYKSDIALGMGWAGNIKDGGLKGEIMYFIPTDKTTRSNLNVSITYDNVFGKTYFQAAALYNYRGQNQINLFSIVGLSNYDFSPKNLFPFKYTTMLNAVFTLSPLSTATMGLVYSPQVNTLILTPSFSYSIADNWDLNAFVQSFFTQLNQFDHFSSSIFIRLKWSY